jgi:hemoglobin
MNDANEERPPSIYDAAGGQATLSALAHAWHRRCLADPLASHPFTHGDLSPQLSQRLADYMGEALGGPPAYTSTGGEHSQVLRLHSGNGAHPELDERAIDLFALAMDDAAVPSDERLREALLGYFRWATGKMGDYPASPDDVPAALPLPHWSWTGPTP